MAGVLLVRHGRARIERDAIGRTRATMTAIDAKLRGVLSTLEGLASSKHLVSGDLRRFHEEAQPVLASQPDWVTITLVSGGKVELLDARAPLGKPRPDPGDAGSLGRALVTGRAAIGNIAAVTPAASS